MSKSQPLWAPVAHILNGDNATLCRGWLKGLNELLLHIKGLAAPGPSIMINAFSVVKPKKNVQKQAGFKCKTYWGLTKCQPDHSEACEICNTTSFQRPPWSKTPLHREMAKKGGTKEIMRKPSIQPLNKASVKPPTVPYHNRLVGRKAGGRGGWRAPY